MCVGAEFWEEGLNALVAHVLKSNAMGEDALMAAGRFLKMSKLELRALSGAFNVYVGTHAVRHNAHVLG